MAHINIATEGVQDEAVARRLCVYSGHSVLASYVAGGKPRLDPKISAYNNAGRFGWWLVLRDLDHDAICAPELISQLLSQRSSGLILRIPVRSIEAWLLADHIGISSYLGVSPAEIPRDPEGLDRPKRTLVDLARRSTRRDIRVDMVPREGLSVEVGIGYTSRVLDFTINHWHPERSVDRSRSLRKCINALNAVR